MEKYKITKNERLKCYNCKYTLNYNKYKFNSRCHLSNYLINTLKLKINTILLLQVQIPSPSSLDSSSSSCITFNVLCCVWPYLEEDENYKDIIILDDSVILGSKINWNVGICEIVKVISPKICTTLKVKSQFDDLNISEFGGLPVANGFTIHSAFRENVTCTVLDQNGVSIVGPLTLLIHTQQNQNQENSVNEKNIIQNNNNHNNNSNSNSNDNNSLIVSKNQELNEQNPTFSCTSVVRNIIQSVIEPKVLFSPYDHSSIQGVLLLGPPGVGKSFAISAVKKICKNSCNIYIHNLSIIEILAHVDPIRATIEILSKVTMINPEDEVYEERKNSISSHTNTFSNDTIISTTSSPQIQPQTPTKYSTTKTTTPSTSKTPSSSKTPFSFKNEDLSSPVGYQSSTPNKQFRTPVTFGSTGNNKNFSIYSQLSNSKKNDSLSTTPISTPRTSTSLSKSSNSTPLTNSPITTSSTSKSLQLSSIHVIMIDEIDALGSGKSTDSIDNVQVVVKSLICKWLDNLSKQLVRVALIATTNRPSEVDPCFRRGGRLEREIDILNSSESDREILLEDYLTFLYNISKQNFPDETSKVNEIKYLSKQLAQSTGGYVAADVASLIKQGVEQMSQINNQDNDINDNNNNITLELESSNISSWGKSLLKSLINARSYVPPSCLRGDLVKIPNLTYNDVIGYDEVKLNINRVLSSSNIETKKQYERFGLTGSMGGILLYGPPGNSKTRLVMAAASSHKLPLITLTTADVYSAYVGDAEAEIRRTFRLARQSRPCIIFLDELDALVTNRGVESSSSNVEGRVLASLLTEMDGIDGNGDGVYVMAATNRIDSIDSALLRKGRFHYLLYVSLPTINDMYDMINYFGNKYSLSNEIQLNLKDQVKEGMSGADIENLCREAGMNRIKQVISLQQQLDSLKIT